MEYVKNAAADGVLIAARLLYYPFMKTEFKTEELFEIGLTENLRTEKITAFSISEEINHEKQQIQQMIFNSASAAQQRSKLKTRYDFIGDVKENISGV